MVMTMATDHRSQRTKTTFDRATRFMIEKYFCHFWRAEVRHVDDLCGNDAIDAAN